MIAMRQVLYLPILISIAVMAGFGCVSDSRATEHGETGETLTPEYLTGRWCYAYIDFGSQREDVGTEYLFNTDGTLEYQVSGRSDKMAPGSFSIKDGQIDIKPTLVMFDLMIDRVGVDEFVLDAMGGKHYFLRGECAG